MSEYRVPVVGRTLTRGGLRRSERLIDSAGMPGARRRILSTLFSGDPPMPVWQERVDTLRPRARDPATIAAVLRLAGRYDAVVLDGSARRDQVAAALLRLRPGQPAIVVADSTWKAGGGLDTVLNRAGIRMIDGPRTTFCVLTRFETESFPRTWRLRSSRVCFTPGRPRSRTSCPSTDNGRVFAGGNSLRDYGPLIAAAGPHRRVGGHRHERAWPALSWDRSLPTSPSGRGPRREYDAMLRAAAVVVVPAGGARVTAPPGRRRMSTRWRAARRSSSPTRPGCATTSPTVRPG